MQDYVNCFLDAQQRLFNINKNVQPRRNKGSPVCSPRTPEGSQNAKKEHEDTIMRVAPLVRRYLDMVLQLFSNRKGTVPYIYIFFGVLVC